MIAFDKYQLGETAADIDIDSAEHQRLAALAMVRQAHSMIAIISRKLDPHAYSTPEFVEALKQLVLNHRRARVRIIVFEAQLIRRRGHLLLDLSGKLSSFIELRKADVQYKNFNQSLLLVDNTAYLLRLSAERYEGRVNFNDKRQTKALAELFEEMWAKSGPDPNLRRMNL